MRGFLGVLFFLATAAHAGSPMIWNSGEFGKMLTSAGFILNDGKQYRILSVDPSAGGGIVAPVGSIGVRENAGLGEGWFKTGAANTAWSNFLTGSTGWSLSGNSGTTAGTNFLGTSDSIDLVFKTDAVERFRITAAGVLDSNLGIGLLHADASGLLTSSLLVNADVNAAAAIAGTKVAPNFGSQNVLTTGTLGAGATVVTGLTIGSLAGPLRGTSGVVSAGNIVLTTEVTGTLPAANGGTGVTSLSDILGTTNQVNVASGTARVIGGNVTLSLPQSIHTGASPTFTGLTLSGLANTYVTSSAGVLSSVTAATLAGALTHNDLLGLTTGDAHTQYGLLAGRSGGQTLTGGTASGNNLVLRSTSNVTKGQVFVDETTVSSSATTGALRVAGGLGVAEDVYAGGDGNFTGTMTVAGQYFSVSDINTSSGLALEETGAGADSARIQAPDSIPASYTLTLPVDAGVSGQVLSTNGSGVLSWSSGGTAVSSFSGTTITGSVLGVQVWRYTGGSAQVLTAITATVVPDGALLEITGTSATNTITLNHNDVASGWILNGSWTGTQYSKIALRWDATSGRFVEAYRNGIQ